MPTFPGTVINGKWYAQSPYGPTNASGGVNVAPYGPWNGMPASGMTPVIGTPTTFTTGGTPQVNTGVGTGTVGSIGSNLLTSPGSATGAANPIGGALAPTLQIGQPSGTPWASALGTAGSTAGATGSFGQGQYQPGASPNLESITNLVNQLDLQAQQASNAGRVPGGQAVENQLMGDTASLARGQLPQDVIDQIQQRAAERGISTGNSDYLKALGLTSLQAEQTAQGNLSAADARNPAAPIFDPTSQILTPGQAGSLNNQLDIANANLQLAWWKALHPELYGGGNRGGAGGSGLFSPRDFPDSTGGLGFGGLGGQGNSLGVGGMGAGSNWFTSLLGGTPTAPPSSGYVGGVSYPNYSGTSFMDLPDLGSPNTFDTLNPAGTTIDSADPFALYG